MNLEPSPSASNSHDFAMNTQAADVQACLKVVHEALEDVKAKDILAIDVSLISNVADAIVIASGTSTRHIKALADNVAEEARKAGFRPLGVEGERDAEWIGALKSRRYSLQAPTQVLVLPQQNNL